MAEEGQLGGIQYYVSLEIKNKKYNPVNITFLIIREWIFNILPTIEIQLVDDGYLIEKSPMEDSEEIKVILAKHENDENPLSMIFLLDDYDIGILGDNRKSIINITGHLKVSNMFELKNKSFPKQNSSSVLAEIANNSKLKFSNPFKIVPSDNMTWYQSNQSNFDFIRHVLKRSYVPDDVLFCYADIYSNLFYTSLNSGIGNEKYRKAKFDIKKAESDVVDKKYKDDTIWFASYSIVNKSGYFNKRIGYCGSYNYYDLNVGISNPYSKTKTLTTLSFRDKNQANKSVENETFRDYNESTLYSTSYFESIVRNKFLKENFFANSLVLNINSLSTVKLMDKIDLYVPSLFKPTESNEVMSGMYLVAGIQHEISRGGVYKKKIALGRNGMNKSSDIKIYTVEENK